MLRRPPCAPCLRPPRRGNSFGTPGRVQQHRMARGVGEPHLLMLALHLDQQVRSSS